MSNVPREVPVWLLRARVRPGAGVVSALGRASAVDALFAADGCVECITLLQVGALGRTCHSLMLWPSSHASLYVPANNGRGLRR